MECKANWIKCLRVKSGHSNYKLFILFYSDFMCAVLAPRRMNDIQNYLHFFVDQKHQNPRKECNRNSASISIDTETRSYRLFIAWIFIGTMYYIVLAPKHFETTVTNWIIPGVSISEFTKHLTNSLSNRNVFGAIMFGEKKWIRRRTHVKKRITNVPMIY